MAVRVDRKTSTQIRGARLRGGLSRSLRQLHPAARWVLRSTVARGPALTRLHDSVVIRDRMRRALGYEPDLRNPRTYNEKLAWRILHDRNPLLPLTTDKVAVRSYVAAKVGDDVLVPLLGVYQRADQIPWSDLPASFVLKASHGCNMNLIVRDKSAEDFAEVQRIASSWLASNYYDGSQEWAYRQIPRQILVEELLVDEHGRLPIDFKFLVFAGRTAAVRVHLDRYGDHRVNFYDSDINLLPVRQDFATDPSYVPPREMIAMAKVAEALAADFDYARIDLYLNRGSIKFGEITHYDGNAKQRFRPDAFDLELGRLWLLPGSGSR
jgi:hypothetical protein